MNKSCGESDLGFFVQLYGQLLGVITQVPSSRILKKRLCNFFEHECYWHAAVIISAIGSKVQEEIAFFESLQN